MGGRKRGGSETEIVFVLDSTSISGTCEGLLLLVSQKSASACCVKRLDNAISP